MALPGMRATTDLTGETRPRNYREGILLTSPRDGASLYRLTAAMKDSKAVDDPEFKWYEELVDMYTYVVSGAQTNVDTTIELAAGSKALRLKPGDTLRNGRTGEVVRIATIPDNTTITVTRGFGGTTAAAMNNTDSLLFIGSAFREGAPKPLGTSSEGEWKRNFCQIFRDPVEWTRTATKTRTRTGDEMKHDRRRIMHKHQLAIERAFWLGQAWEGMESGQPIRTTGGVLSFIPAANTQAVLDGGGLLDMDEIESLMPRIFAYGSSEKLAYGSLASIMAINKAIRKNSEYTWVNNQKEYGMHVMRLVTPAGVLVLTEHPAFGQAGDFLAKELVILDTENLGYRYITDTTLLKDRQNRGDDGVAEEWLTEAGLLMSRPETHFRITGINGGKADD